ncbi:jg24164 [Pararge aegeria aegeria]|uniref:Jg24164 protein n=1 Tax=Pararge aegeria aegeria TaxID=348720 RepID=A0A8S4S4P4_9NEOP|nr:jg24164 [Pararge aegeria aegeria]
MEEFLRPNETSEQFYARCTNLTAFDCSEDEMLWCIMGPRRLPLTRIVPITVALLLICLTGVAGNVAVCVVIVRHPAMRSDTNYYLFSLALSDLLLLLFGESSAGAAADLPHDDRLRFQCPALQFAKFSVSSTSIISS